jgi:ribulose-bisphosphate carboxylase large chain
MGFLDSQTLDSLWSDWDAREVRLRQVITERLREHPPPVLEDQIVATYFLAQRTETLHDSGKEIVYHATSGTHDYRPGSLLDQCTAETVGEHAFDSTGRIGLLHVAFPLKMMLHPDGSLTSTDILHTTAGPIIFDVFERQDARLVSLGIPNGVIQSFPGPAYGPTGLREITGFGPQEPAFGTILKPTAGITPEQVGKLVEQAATCELFLFVKEDENLYPDLDYSPAVERTRSAVSVIESAQTQRGDKGLIFAPHIGGSPSQVVETALAVVEAGATGVMFSETYAGGTVRMVRDATKHMERPPAIYGHNAGIGTRTRCIWREVIDLLARLDGIDFRQTAPVKPGAPFLRPYGDEWIASEKVLSQPLPGIHSTMIVRAGGLDQGNIGLNLADAEHQGITKNVLFLAGSAINSIKDKNGKPNPELGAQAMREALEVHQSGDLKDASLDEHLPALRDLAERKGLKALMTALEERYPSD